MQNTGDYKIMTVDDDEEIRSSISLLLETEGFQTIHAKNGRVALDYLLATPDEKLPDLILLDFMMPVMSGDAFCKSLSEYSRLSHIPVVMMTAGGNLVKLMDRVDTAAVGYLSKPMDVHSVLSMIEHSIQLQKKVGQADSVDRSQSSDAEESPGAVCEVHFEKDQSEELPDQNELS